MAGILDEFVRLVTSRPNYQARGFINIDCPSCGDTRKRGGFALTDTGGFRYSCFNGGCDFNLRPTGWEPNNGLHGRVKQLFELLGGDRKNIPVSEFFVNKEVNQQPLRERPVTKFMDSKLPRNTMMLDDVMDFNEDAEEVAAYLFDRCPYFLECDYPFMWSRSHPRHVILPYIHTGGQIVGYLGRCIDEDHGARRFMQKAPRDYMFGQHTVYENKDEFLFVVESPFDAVLLHGVGIRENKLTIRQINLLKRVRRKIVMVPDRVKGDMEPFIKAAADNDWYVFIPKEKDIGDTIRKNGLLWSIQSITSGMTKNYNKLRIQQGVLT